jgi:hypothetical protein
MWEVGMITLNQGKMMTTEKSPTMMGVELMTMIDWLSDEVKYPP